VTSIVLCPGFCEHLAESSHLALECLEVLSINVREGEESSEYGRYRPFVGFCITFLKVRFVMRVQWTLMQLMGISLDNGLSHQITYPPFPCITGASPEMHRIMTLLLFNRYFCQFAENSQSMMVTWHVRCTSVAGK